MSETAKVKINVVVNANESPRFILHDTRQVNEALQYLDDHGYVVIAQVASESEVLKARDDFWEFSKSATADIDRHDPSTWKGRNWIADTSNGIHNARGFNHSDFLWNARLLPGVKKAFASIWKTNDLIVSYDAGNVFRPWKYDPTWLTHGGWWHVDQNCLKGKSRQGLVCVQGVVTYYDATEDTGGLCVIPGSHKHHEELCNRTAMAKTMHDFVPVESSDPLMQQGSGILVCAKAGDLILWDSRTIHCNTPALTAANSTSISGTLGASSDNVQSSDSILTAADTRNVQNTTPHSTENATGSNNVNANDEETVVNNDPSAMNTSDDDNKIDLIRLCAYVCMVPRSFATAAMIEKRKFAFVNRIRTSHWPAQLIEHGYAVDDPVDPTECSRERLELAGFHKSDWDVKRNSKLRSIMNGKDVNGDDESINSSKCCVM